MTPTVLVKKEDKVTVFYVNKDDEESVDDA